jgi:hypothetical protein
VTVSHPSKPNFPPARHPGYNRGMSVALSVLIALAAAYIWLTVRIVNRRERWAKWTLAALAGLPVLYVTSFGPACWLTSRPLGDGSVPPSVMRIYAPMARLAQSGTAIGDLVRQWWFLWIPLDHVSNIPIGPNTFTGVANVSDPNQTVPSPP